MTPGRVAMAAIIVMACAVPMRLFWNGPATAEQTAPASGDRSLPPAIEQQPPLGIETPPPVPRPRAAETLSGSALPPIEPRSRSAAPAAAMGTPPRVAGARALLPGSASAAGSLRVGQNIPPPIRTFNVSPIYPEAAQAAGIEGLVVLQVIVGEDGSIRDVQVVQSVPELDQAAMDAVLQWQYEPTLLNGEPVEVEMNVHINFTLR